MMGGADLKKRLAEKFLTSDRGTAMISLVAQAEREVLEAVQDQHEVIGVDHLEDLPTVEDRVEFLREGYLAMISGEFPAWWVEHCAPFERSEEAATFADLDDEEWQSQIQTWAETYRSNGVEGSDEELADGHVRRRYDVDLETFERQVVEWPDERVPNTLEEITMSGIRTGVEGIERTTEVLEDEER